MMVHVYVYIYMYAQWNVLILVAWNMYTSGTPTVRVISVQVSVFVNSKTLTALVQTQLQENT